MTTATEQDFKSKRRFCYIRVTINESGVRIEAHKGMTIWNMEKASTVTEAGLYFPGLGSIACRALGELALSNESAYEYCGFLVDYEENYIAALDKALMEAEKVRLRKADEWLIRWNNFKQAPITIDKY
jgi:hypothetical protein